MNGPRAGTGREAACAPRPLAASLPLHTRFQEQRPPAPPTFSTAKNSSRHCQLSPGMGTKCPWWRAVLKDSYRRERLFEGERGLVAVE